VSHDIVCDQVFPVMHEHHSPLEVHPDLVGTPCQFSQSQSAMPMRVAKGRPNIGDGLRGFFPHPGRQSVSRFPDSLRKENPDHSLPVKAFNLRALREAAISASAESSEIVARASVTPYSSNAGKLLGRNGRPRSFTICAKNIETAAVGVMPISRHTTSASSARWLSIRSLICSVMHQMCLEAESCQEGNFSPDPGGTSFISANCFTDSSSLHVRRCAGGGAVRDHRVRRQRERRSRARGWWRIRCCG